MKNTIINGNLMLKREDKGFMAYLLSDQRRKRFEAISMNNLEDRLSVVHDADIRNFYGENAE